MVNFQPAPTSDQKKKADEQREREERAKKLEDQIEEKAKALKLKEAVEAEVEYGEAVVPSPKESPTPKEK